MISDIECFRSNRPNWQLRQTMEQARRDNDNPLLNAYAVRKGDWGRVVSRFLMMFAIIGVTVSGLTTAFYFNPNAQFDLTGYPLLQIICTVAILVTFMSWYTIARMYFKPRGWLYTGTLVSIFCAAIAAAALSFS